METSIVLITIVVYAIVMLIFGYLAGKKTDTLAGMTVGKRNAGAWLTAMSYGCAYFSAVMFIGYSGASGWNYGIWAVAVGLGNAVFGSYLAWKVLAKRTRSLSHYYHIKSMPQMFEKRFQSRKMKVFSSIVIFIFLLPYSASVYKGLASICSVMLNMSDTTCMIVIAVVSALLLIFGGYLATIKADFIQGIIIFIGVCLLVVFVLRSDTVVAGGGIKGLLNKLDETGVTPLSAKSVIALGATVLMTSFGTWGLPQMIHKYYGIKDEKEIKRGTIISTVFAFVVAGGGYFIGGFSRMFFSNEQFAAMGGADYVVPNMLKESGISSIMIGLVVVLLISASVSTLSSIAISGCTTVVMDIVKPFAKKERSDKSYTLLLKVFFAVFVALSYVVANTDTPILDMMSYSWGILSGSFLAPYFLSLFGKKMTKASAWVGMMVGFVTALIPAICKIITIISPATEGIIKTLAGYGPHFAVGAIVLSFAASFIFNPVCKKMGSELNTEFYEKAGI